MHASPSQLNSEVLLNVPSCTHGAPTTGGVGVTAEAEGATLAVALSL